MREGVYGGPKRTSDPLKLELQVVVSFSVCELGIKPGFSTVIANVLSH